MRGRLPRVGIRPTIDGRYGGVRESLEATVMAMAERAASLIEKSLRHSCGAQVECVIADTCIGGTNEAALCEEKFLREGVGVSLTVTPCWCYGFETIDMHPTRPKAIWGFNGTERPGAVYLAAALAGHAQKGVPCFGIYGDQVQDSGDTTIPDDVAEKILRFVKAGLGVATMQGCSYLAIGGVSMGIAGSVVDHGFFEKWLGMRVETIDMSEVTRRIEKGIFDPAEFDLALRWTRDNCPEGQDWNDEAHTRTREQKDADWAMSIKMAIIVRDLMVGNPKLAELGFKEEAQGRNALAGGFQGQRQWTDYLPNGDFMEAVLTSSFDWNGIRQPFAFATENDSLNAVSMLFGHLLTGTAQLFSDVRTYWSPEAVKRVTGHELAGAAEGGIIHLINSGPSALDWTGESSFGKGTPVVKPWWQMTEKDAKACLESTKWCPSMTEYFTGGGWSTDFLTKGGMPVTMCRINMVSGLGPVMQIVEGWTVELPDAVHKVLDERTNPTWPSTWFAPRLGSGAPYRSVYEVMAHWGANHGAVCYGHIGEDLLTLSSMLRIPVDMHNCDGAFRPAAWDRFGSLDAQGADYRACANFGPLYG